MHRRLQSVVDRSGYFGVHQITPSIRHSRFSPRHLSQQLNRKDQEIKPAVAIQP
jgi:hypothetical protein